MNANWHTYPDAVTTADACANHVTGLLGDALSRQEYATIAVSGGSSPKLMFERLAVVSLPWERIHVFFVDERCVPPDDDQSNYKMVHAHLIRPAGIPASNVHRILGEIPPPEAAERYAQEIRDFFQPADGQLPRFDIIHLGMGPDAHTASLFPGEPLIDDRAQISASAYVEKFKQWRVTLLPGVLLEAGNRAFLVAGADKAEALHSVLRDDYDPKRYPAQIVARQNREVSWFVDEAASALLK